MMIVASKKEPETTTDRHASFIPVLFSLMLLCGTILLYVNIGFAATYWVSPSGGAAWAACRSVTALNGTAACSLSTANNNAIAGDTIYLRGGTYNQTASSGCGSNYACGIEPRNLGTAGARITYSAYSGETPIITADPLVDFSRGISIHQGTGSGVGTYIRVTGITFKNLSRWASLYNYANYNEIDHCIFYSDTGEDVTQAVKVSGGCAGGSLRNCYSTHNWFHHNTFSRAHRAPGDPTTCYEGRDLFDIGDAYTSSFPEDEHNNNYNTVEDNTFSYAGHTCFDGFGMYTVFKNNRLHNEPWITSDGASCAYANDQYSNPSFNGKYGHRVFGISNDYDRPGTYNLVEGNRFGFGSTNPNNNGADGLDLMAPRNIVRYNYIFGAMNSGFMFKYGYSTRGHGGTNNRMYNNTLYHNGYGNPWYESVRAPRNSTSPEALLHIRFYQSDTIDNVVKNNLLYDSRRYALSSFDIGSGASTSSYPASNVVLNNWLTSNGDPRFNNPDLTDPTSATLPNLTLKMSSRAINGGTYLTQANGTGSNSTTLIVDDAMYFQGGIWGSDLARGVTLFPDWIAIGTVTNVVQIVSINYNTNTLTLASPKSWSNRAPIWLYKKSDGSVVLVGTAPDYGANEFPSTVVRPPANLRRP